MSSGDAPADDTANWRDKNLADKKKEYEVKKARAKALKLRLTCTICGEKAKLNCPCETTQYCSTECQRIDWRDRGHRKVCKKIEGERAAEAARAEDGRGRGRDGARFATARSFAAGQGRGRRGDLPPRREGDVF